MTRAAAQLIVSVHCHASAPARRAEDGATNAECHNVLGFVPGPLTFVGLRARRPDTPDGRVWLQCGRQDCRTWNVFATKDDG